jgi:hypothetical protein
MLQSNDKSSPGLVCKILVEPFSFNFAILNFIVCAKRFCNSKANSSIRQLKQVESLSSRFVALTKAKNDRRPQQFVSRFVIGFDTARRSTRYSLCHLGFDTSYGLSAGLVRP